MKSLVLDLQQSALDSSGSTTDLLRMALVAARKIGSVEIRKWIDHELNGYGDSPRPDYRHVRGQLKAHNRVNGWIPVIVADVEIMESLTNRSPGQPIGQLESVLSENEGGELQIPLSHETLEQFADSEEFRLGMIPTLLVSRSQVVGIIDAVRSRILNWSLDLEDRGVLGEGLTFSREEVREASSVSFNINEFTGVIGDVSNSSIQVGDYGSIHADLKGAGISQEARNELEDLLDEMKSADDSEREGLVARGVDWVAKHGERLGALAATITEWFA